jgi:hypothetical protein
LKAQLLRVGSGWYEVMAEVFDRAHGLERARHHLGGARAAWGVGDFRLEQFGVGEDDAELIVQSMEQEAEFRCINHVTPLGCLGY